MAIDVGSLATDRGSSHANLWTKIDTTNPANATGIIDTVRTWYETAATGFYVGTFYLVSGTDYKCRDSVSIGNVASGSEQTFSGLSENIESGDFIGCYETTGRIEFDTSGGSGLYRIKEYQIDPANQATYALAGSYPISLYGTGTEAAAGWTGKISGVTNPTKIMGVATSGITKVKGVT